LAVTDNLKDAGAMLKGVLIGDSLRPGTVLEGFPLTVTRIERAQAGQGEQPPFWTMIWFEVPDRYAEQLADVLAEVLVSEYGWYCDFQSDSEVTVVFAGRTFRYRRGDVAGRSEVVAYARSVGVPDAQLDWSE
jgi:hypothetical protein